MSLAAVQAALPDGAVLIDVVRLYGSQVVKGKGPVRTPARYVAWVTGKTGAPKVVDLGPAADGGGALGDRGAGPRARAGQRLLGAVERE